VAEIVKNGYDVLALSRMVRFGQNLVRCEASTVSIFIYYHSGHYYQRQLTGYGKFITIN